jgi:hypothetical protein
LWFLHIGVHDTNWKCLTKPWKEEEPQTLNTQLLLHP